MTKAEKTRQFIIEQSAPLFNRKGIAATSMSDIMTVTKMAKGGLYGNFESKEELALAIVDHNLQLMAVSLTTAVNKANTAKEKLYAYLDYFKTPVQFPVPGGCPILNFGTEADDNYPVIKEKVKQLIRAAQSMAETIIKKGIENGEFKKTFNAKAFSILLFSALEGSIHLSRVLNTNSQMSVVISMLKEMIEAQTE